LDEGEKLGVIQGNKLGIKEGIERGMDLGREEGYRVAKEGFDGIIQGVKAKGTPKKSITHETATQTNDDPQRPSTATQTTSASTIDAVMQTVANDEQPPSRKNAGTSTDSPRSSQTTPSTVVTDPPLPPLPDTTPLMTLAQPPRATSTTATRTAPSAATQLQTPRK
jgi:hypothetical protein